MGRVKRSLLFKLRVVEEADSSKNVKATARKHGVSLSNIRRWRQNYPKIKEMAMESPQKCTLLHGRKIQNPEIEEALYAWIKEQRSAELCVSTHDVIDKAISIDPEFKNGDEKTLLAWVYKFLQCRNLSVRTRTRVSQIPDAAMQSVKRAYCQRVMTTYSNRIKDPKLFVNMDETAVYLNCSPKRTIHHRGERTVAIRIGGTSSMRFTLAVTVAMDGTKLPLFVIFKGKPGGNIEKNLQEILPEGVIGCVQKKG